MGQNQDAFAGAAERAPRSPSQDELTCLIRGISGGFIFAIPILYTMEVWWLAYTTPTWKVLLVFLVGYGLCVGLNVFSGFREEIRRREYLMDATTALGASALVAAVMLTVMGVLTLETAANVALKQIMLMAVPTSIGFSLARSVLGSGEGEANEARGLRADLIDVGMTIVGGVFLGLSVAPTEEILLIATQGSWLHWVSLAGLSILLSFALIFMAEVSGQSRRLASEGILQSPWGETLVCYGVSLGVAYVLLWFMGFLVDGASPHEVLSMVLVLGLPCTIGGAAGRLIV